MSYGYGPTTYYENPPAPFYWVRYSEAAYGKGDRHQGWAQTWDEARQKARAK